MYTVDKTQDEDGKDRFFITNAQGDWIGQPYDTEELALNAIAEHGPLHWTQDHITGKLRKWDDEHQGL